MNNEINLWTISFGPDYCLPYIDFSKSGSAAQRYRYTFTNNL